MPSGSEGTTIPRPRGGDYFSNGTWTFGPLLLATPLVAQNPVDLGQNASLRDPYNNASAPYTFSWSLGDGNVSTQQELVHGYMSAGTYRVDLRVTDGRGNFNNSSVWVTVNVDPTLSVRATLPATDVGYPVNLSAVAANGTTPYSYAWSLGDGNVSSGANVTHAYGARAFYNISVTMTDGAGMSLSANTTVNVANLPLATLNVSPGVIDVGQDVTFAAGEANGTGPFTFLFLGLPGECPAASGPILVCRPTSAGSYTVGATVRDGVGAVNATSTQSLVVFVLPAVSLTGSRDAIDLGQPVTFEGQTILQGSGGLTFQYGGLPPGCTGPTYPHYTCTPTQTGSYSIALIVADRAGGMGSASSVSLLVSAPLAVTLNVSATNVTLGATTTLTAEVAGGTGPLTFAYYGLPPGCAGANQSPLICSPNETGVYDVYVRVTDGTGASAQGNRTVSVIPSTEGLTGPLPYPTIPVALALIAAGVAAVALFLRRRLRSRGRGMLPADAAVDTASGESGG